MTDGILKCAVCDVAIAATDYLARKHGWLVFGSMALCHRHVTEPPEVTAQPCAKPPVDWTSNKAALAPEVYS